MLRVFARGALVLVVACADSHGSATPLPPLEIQHVKPFVMVSSVASFEATPVAVGDSIVVGMGCITYPQPTFAISAPGWSFTELGPLAGVNGIWDTSFAAIAPATGTATFAVTAGTPCNLIVVGDEFSGTDTTGGSTTFDAFASNANHGDNSPVQFTTGSAANDALWGASFTGDCLESTDGNSPGAVVGASGWTEYRLTRDLPHSPEVVNFGNCEDASFAAVAIALAPQPLHD